jgi:hypothetical protein
VEKVILLTHPALVRRNAPFTRLVLGRHWALTESPASTNMAFIILRTVDLSAASLEGLFEHPVVALTRHAGHSLSDFQVVHKITFQ